jgi:hypothetical protein
MRVTLARLEAGWLALCVLGWLLLGSWGAREEAECRDTGAFLCFSTGEVFYLVGLLALAALIVGAFVIALAWASVRAVRRRG